MSHFINCRSASICLILASALSNPMRLLAHNPSDKSFSIDNDTYYLHQISYHDFRNNNPETYDWNQTILADKKYIYIADHEKNSKTLLTIKRFSALDGSPAEDLIIDETEMDNFGLLELAEEQLNFYLVDSKNEDYFVLMPNPPYEGISKTNPQFSFYLIDKSGHIETEYFINKVIINTPSFIKDLSFFGIPDFKGDLLNGDFDLFLPILDNTGLFCIVKFVFENKRLKSNSTIFYSDNTLSRPSVKIIDDDFLLIDDDRMKPSIYSYNFNNNYCYDSLDQNHTNAHGVNCFYFDGYRMICTGDIQSGNNVDMTQFNIGLWDDNKNVSTQISSQSEPTANFSNYKNLISLQFGESTRKHILPSGYTYRQFMAVSDYGNTVKHLHFYVPGEFLATYQINKHDIPTGIDNIATETGQQYVNLSVKDKQLSFDRPIGNISVFNYMGVPIFYSAAPITTVDMSKYTHGIYIIKTPEKSIKISL